MSWIYVPEINKGQGMSFLPVHADSVCSCGCIGSLNTLRLQTVPWLCRADYCHIICNRDHARHDIWIYGWAAGPDFYGDM